MKIDFCAICGSKEDLHLHHLDPIVYNGGKSIRKKFRYDENKPIKDCTPQEIFNCLFDRGFVSENSTITVCSWHHKILHGIVSFQKTHHSDLIKEGIRKRIQQGKPVGRPSKLNDTIKTKVLELREKGLGVKQICRLLKIGCGTYYTIMKNI